MKKLFFLSVIFVMGLLQADAQTELNIKSGDKGLYLDHAVAAKEGLYSIGRLYNVNPKHIAAFNQIDLNKGLNIDQVIHIPLSDTNFTQKSKNGVPVYYTVGANEGLQKISSANNKVSLQNLRNWNSIKGDNVTPGSKLVVGFLVSKEMPAVAINKPVKQEAVKVVEEKSVAKTTTPEKTVIKEPVIEQQQLPKEETKKTETVTEVKTQPNPEQKKTEAVFTKAESTTLDRDNGYFKTYFDQQVRVSPATRNTTVTSGIFKTVSGWQDAKYYMLIDGVAAGNIIRIINPENNKAVYAKVLGEMNGIRQNQGLGTRISSAAASALGITDTEKFVVKLNY